MSKIFTMDDPLVATQPPPQPSDLCLDDFSVDLDQLPIPSMDSLFWPENNAAVPSESFAFDLDSGLYFGENQDYDITFDDLDNLYFPSDADDFFLTDGYSNPTSDSISMPPFSPVKINDDCAAAAVNGFDYNVGNSESTESGDSALSGDRSSVVSRFLNSQAADSDSDKKELPLTVSGDNSGNPDSYNSLDVKVSGFLSPESDFCCREESRGEPVSSQGSGNGRSGVCEVMNSSSPERDISSHANAIADRNVNMEEIGRGYDLKRKKTHSEGNAEARTTKCQRSSENANQQCGINAAIEEEEKRTARLMRNRESAQLSRQRKKHYVEELEEKVRSMNSTIANLNGKISFVMAENATLRQQLNAAGMCPAPAPGMYPYPPMAPMTYPWVPYAPYVVKPQGSQVPLVPIHRIKSRQSMSASRTKKSESKKAEVKTKQVASISFLGLFFFIMVFGGLVPLVNVEFGGLVDNFAIRSTYVSDSLYVKGGGKVWPVNGHINGSETNKGVGFSTRRYSISDRIYYEKGRKLGDEMQKEQDPCLDEFVHLDNSSEPLLASLYVPRNDKLVKIDGNLIIHSIMAGEKAMASQSAQTKKDIKETSFAIPKDWDSALAIPEVGKNRGRHPHIHRSPPELMKALASSSAKTLKDHMKSTAIDGKMQQWFSEGLAGPMLSSGMCTEVFQFDAFLTPRAIVPASSVANISAENRQIATSLTKSRNRRILNRLSDSLAGSGLNITEEDGVRSSQKINFHGNKSVSSMVVSVLVDPKEAGNGDADGMITPKSLSQIFVVVLIDSVKYVTYSCGLPRASPHLMTS